MRAVTALLCLAIIGGCVGDGYGGAPTKPDHATVDLTLSSTDAMTSAGDTRVVTAARRDAEPAVISPPFVWSSSAPAVATVSGDGATATITAVDDGTAVIAATNGTIQGTVTVTVQRRLASVVLSSPALQLPYGSVMQLTATARDARQNVLTGVSGFAYTSSNPTTVMVSESGELVPLFQFRHSRVATITATLTRNGVTASDSKTILVLSPANIDYAALMLGDLVVPARAPTIGAGAAFFLVEGARINYIITWSALSDPAIDAHIHAPGSAAEVGEVVVDLAPRGQVDTFGTLTGSFTAADIRSRGGRPAIALDSLITLMGNQSAYVDVHTTAFPGGEIRGPVVGPLK